ncbi:molybdopterin biosynthesis protein MoeA [Formosa agariphila KMM 3901]|uniref:Molybdopterin molybdenumtransferase n=1 Tax=Formosa agariphila (strain DSM 15362 / KCTC 12365 / LMG 23005 / KMM 3901 / M-2Alg 35-1) TaxID=1347342 RepID=T2KIW1_FORAG|nr:gephyrin-like molybdotransferase Glp [Formosa agariphila]CDF78373.1 molybdopterin biosynthesis protein MoeA [Formosa agariphila KMM 3901]
MISVQQALHIIDTTKIVHHIKKVKISKSLGFILAEDILAPINMPSFRQSAMDGYAIIWSDNTDYKVTEESKAGDAKHITLQPLEAVRIFTGAKVPDTADTVVMQEHVSKHADGIRIIKMPRQGANVRPVGEQVHAGDKVLTEGTRLNEAAIGFLAGLGISKIAVYNTPKVSVLVTGNELQTHGKPLKDGAIYESNSVMLKMALQRFGIKKIKIFKAKDTLKATNKAIKKALDYGDILLISGGISVGDYDFVKEALDYNHVNELFYKINQKPGKPLWFGKKDQQFVFALPGNPASALTAFYVYVLPILKKYSGFSDYHLPRLQAKLNSAFKNTTGKTLFLKGYCKDGNVGILPSQQSSMLNTFATSNVLVTIPEDVENLEAQEHVTCINLDGYGN